MKLLLGDCLERMRELPDNSVDAIVTDPPYGISFTNKKWDHDVPSKEIWEEALRVVKPGGYLLSFGGTRTYHRLVVNIEDAGWAICDQLQYLFGSGFPKNHDISKALDKKAGAQREVIGVKHADRYPNGPGGNGFHGGPGREADGSRDTAQLETAPATPEAEMWHGYGTALKPANEPICLAQKPRDGTYAKNVLKHGAGGLNINGCRIPTSDTGHRPNKSGKLNTGAAYGSGERVKDWSMDSAGRWPANVVLDEEAAKTLDDQSGVGNSGGASRFFYCAKASRKEKEAGLDHLEPNKHGRCNTHPTVKPIALMQWLVRLVAPPENPVIMDPFMGSGSTGIACAREDIDFIGIEREAEYMEIAKGRIEAATPEEPDSPKMKKLFK